MTEFFGPKSRRHHSGGTLPKDFVSMKKIIEFSKHAKECRALAAQTKSADHRAQLLRMAESWDQLAHDRAGARAADKDRRTKPKH
jgi:hypothetical protein